VAVTFAIPGFTLTPAQSPRTFEVAVPSGPTDVAIDLDRTSFAQQARSLTVTLQISYDDGGSWNELFHATYPGGTVRGDGGVILTSIHIETTFHQPQSDTRRARADLTAIGGNFATSGGSLQAFP
jgi:hypothetical protein